MEWWRKGIVILIGLTLVGVTILTWGSMGSIITPVLPGQYDCLSAAAEIYDQPGLR